MKISNESKVGILAVFALVVLLFGFSFLKGNNLFLKDTKLSSRFDEVDGLIKSNPVLLYGLQVGRVDDIALIYGDKDNKKLLVKYKINNGVVIPKNSVAHIVSKDILGAMVLEIVPPEKNVMPPAETGDTLHGEVEQSLTKSISKVVEPVQAKITKLLGSVDTVVNSLNVILDAKSRNNLKQSLTSISNTIAHIESVSIKFDNLTTTESTRLHSILTNVDNISGALNSNTGSINKIVTNFSSISDTLKGVNFKKIIDEANRSLTDVRYMLDKAQKGEGSLGLLLNDKKLYSNLEASSRNVDSLIIDVKKRPYRYIHFSVFGRKTRD